MADKARIGAIKRRAKREADEKTEGTQAETQAEQEGIKLVPVKPRKESIIARMMYKLLEANEPFYLKMVNGNLVEVLSNEEVQPEMAAASPAM